MENSGKQNPETGFKPPRAQHETCHILIDFSKGHEKGRLRSYSSGLQSTTYRINACPLFSTGFFSAPR